MYSVNLPVSINSSEIDKEMHGKLNQPGKISYEITSFREVTFAIKMNRKCCEGGT